MPVIRILGKQRQEDGHKFKVSLDCSSRPTRLQSETLPPKERDRERGERRGKRKKEGERRKWRGGVEKKKEKGERGERKSRKESKQK